MAEFVLHVSDLDDAGRDFTFEVKPSWLDEHLKDASLRHDPAFGAGELEVHAQENGPSEYLVTGSLHAHVLTECGRCLGEAKLEVDTTIATLFARTAAKPVQPGRARKEQRFERHEGDAEDEDDLPREEFSGNEIPLDELVREHIVIEVPMQPLCSESCTGIAIPAHVRPPEDVFAGSGAVDPRLAPLQRLRDNVPPVAPPGEPGSSSAATPASSKASKPKK
jgi:uncharacterized protein